MDTQKPTLDEWRRLYALAEQVKVLEPWEWMDETDIFGIQHPEDGRQGFVSIMGGGGEYFSVGLYLGSEGLYGFWDIQDSAPFVNPMELLNIPQLQVSFGSRDEVEKEDREIIKALGLKLRGKNAWPLFRSFSPGLMPWFLEQHEVEFLSLALEQLLEFAPRLRDNPEMLFADPDTVGTDDGIIDDDDVEFDMDDEDLDEEEEEVLMRIPSKDGDTITWTEHWMTIPFPELPKVPLSLDMKTLATVRTLRKENLIVELGVFILPAPIAEANQRPYFPHLMLAVDSRTMAIVGNDLMAPLPTQDEMWSQLPELVVDGFASMGLVPQEIRVMSDHLIDILEPVANACKFKLTLVDELPALFAAQESLAAIMGGMPDMMDDDVDDFPFSFS